MGPMKDVDDSKSEENILIELQKLSDEIDDLEIPSGGIMSMLSEDDDLDLNGLEELLSDIQDEIDEDIIKMRDLQSNGKMILWLYKDFVDEEDCNKWLEVFSGNIQELRPTADERLSFYVKLSTYGI